MWVRFLLALPFWKFRWRLFLTQLSNNQINEAYESTSKDFKAEVSQDQFEAFLDYFAILRKIKTSSFNSFSVENNATATVGGTITATDGQVSPVELFLVNENDVWRLLSLNLNPDVEDVEMDWME